MTCFSDMLKSLTDEETINDFAIFVTEEIEFAHDLDLSEKKEKIKSMNEDEIVSMLENLDEKYDIGLFEDFNEDTEIDVPDYLIDSEYEILDEGMLTQKERRMRAIRSKKKERLGAKAQTMSFKRNYYFDKEKRKFVKRDHALSVQTIKKKAKRFKKIIKKTSTKMRALRSRKRFANAPIHV